MDVESNEIEFYSKLPKDTLQWSIEKNQEHIKQLQTAIDSASLLGYSLRKWDIIERLTLMVANFEHVNAAMQAALDQQK